MRQTHAKPGSGGAVIRGGAGLGGTGLPRVRRLQRTADMLHRYATTAPPEIPRTVGAPPPKPAGRLNGNSNGRVYPLAGAPGRQGLGFVATAGAIASTGGVVGATLPAWFIPVIGPLVAGATIGISKLFSRKSGKQKRATTDIVNEASAAMKQNLEAYLAGPHTVSSQAQALENFDAAWMYIEQSCSDPNRTYRTFGDAGRRCISERKRGGVYDYFASMRDPIANDKNVVPDPTLFGEFGGPGKTIVRDPVTGEVTVIENGGGSNTLWLLLGGGLLLYVVMKQ